MHFTIKKVPNSIEFGFLICSHKPRSNEAVLLPSEEMIPPNQLKKINEMRQIHYNLPYQVILDTNALLVTSEFKNGPKPFSNMIMVEKHFYKNHQIKSYEFW